VCGRGKSEFFHHILDLIKTSDKPFYNFLSGGAGVGKSHLVKSLYQAALKYNSRAGEDFSEVKILLLAPTGKTAFGIKGITVHRLIFLDEISMIGNTTLNVQINNRLKDIKGSTEHFGGVSIIALVTYFSWSLLWMAMFLRI